MAAVPPTALIPFPEKLTPLSGSFALGATTSIEAGAELRSQAELLRDQLRPASGLPLPIVTSAEGSRIPLALDPSLASLGHEGSPLTAGAEAVAIRAPTPAGVLRGSQTLRQLLPPE